MLVNAFSPIQQIPSVRNQLVHLHYFITHSEREVRDKLPTVQKAAFDLSKRTYLLCTLKQGLFLKKGLKTKQKERFQPQGISGPPQSFPL